MRKDFDEVLRNFNKMRMENQGVKFLRLQLFDKLKSIGINKLVAEKMVSKGIIVSQSLNNGKRTKVYSFKDSPLYKDTLRSLYAQKEKKIRLTDALDIVKASGYKVQKPIGFDEKSFSQDYPELYLKYLVYESLD